MSGPWALRMPRCDFALAGSLRLESINVCHCGDDLWLRGDALDDALVSRLRCLPGRLAAILPDGQLRALDERVPRGYLPTGDWTPLADWLAVELPTAGLPGRLAERAHLSLVRSRDVAEVELVLTTADAWRKYAASASQLRLNGWRFAVCADGRVLVHGAPAVPLPGQRYACDQGVAVPAGWAWDPPVEAAVVRELLGLAGEDLALFDTDGSWQSVPAAEFVKASRSAARAVAGGRADA